MKKKATYKQRWFFNHWFAGPMVQDFPLEMDADTISKELDLDFHHDNWDRKSLKKGKKVKV